MEQEICQARDTFLLIFIHPSVLLNDVHLGPRSDLGGLAELRDCVYLVRSLHDYVTSLQVHETFLIESNLQSLLFFCFFFMTKETRQLHKAVIAVHIRLFAVLLLSVTSQYNKLYLR